MCKTNFQEKCLKYKFWLKNDQNMTKIYKTVGKNASGFIAVNFVIWHLGVTLPLQFVNVLLILALKYDPYQLYMLNRIGACRLFLSPVRYLSHVYS